MASSSGKNHANCGTPQANIGGVNELCMSKTGPAPRCPQPVWRWFQKRPGLGITRLEPFPTHQRQSGGKEFGFVWQNRPFLFPPNLTLTLTLSHPMGEGEWFDACDAAARVAAEPLLVYDPFEGGTVAEAVLEGFAAHITPPGVWFHAVAPSTILISWGVSA
jgi:hypothetical protein